MYDTDELFNLAEWHDSFLWDHVRREFQDQGLIQMHNLNPADPSQGKAGHPFINSVLGTVMDHMKVIENIVVIAKPRNCDHTTIILIGKRSWLILKISTGKAKNDDRCGLHDYLRLTNGRR